MLTNINQNILLIFYNVLVVSNLALIFINHTNAKTKNVITFNSFHTTKCNGNN